MKKTLIIIPTNEIGGAELLLKSIALEQSNRGLVNLVYLFSNKPVGEHENINLNMLSKHSLIIGYIKLLFYLRKNSPFFLVISSQVYLNGYLGFFRKLKFFKINNLVIRETTLVFQRYRSFRLLTFKLFYKLGYNFSDLLICSTKLMKQQLIENIHDAQKWNIKVIQNPIDLNKMNQQSDDDLFFFNYSKIDFIVAAGRLIKDKGFDVLIDAFNSIKDIYPNLFLIILGEGKEKKNLLNKIKGLNLDSKIILPGFFNNPIPFFKNARACVVPSIIEGFPNVLLQMMSQNDCVISTTCAGEIDKIPGLITCNPGDSNQLADKIIFALQQENSIDTRNLFNSYLKKNSVKNYINTILTSI